MGQSPYFIVNSPAANITTSANVWNGCIAGANDSVHMFIEVWSGANATGSLVAVTGLKLTVWDDTLGQANTSVGPGTWNSANVFASGPVNGHAYLPEFIHTNATAPGSIRMYTTWSTGQAYIPSISSISTGQGGQGTSVVITGTNFLDASTVTFNGVSAAFTINSQTQITATVPAGCGSGPIVVGNGAGNSNNSGTFNSVPSISSFTPTIGGPGVSVTISGINFNSASAVKFNGVTASYTVNSDTQITATVPSGAAVGPISVTTSDGTATSALSFISGVLHRRTGGTWTLIQVNARRSSAWAYLLPQRRSGSTYNVGG